MSDTVTTKIQNLGSAVVSLQADITSQSSLITNLGSIASELVTALQSVGTNAGDNLTPESQAALDQAIAGLGTIQSQVQASNVTLQADITQDGSAVPQAPAPSTPAPGV